MAWSKKASVDSPSALRDRDSVVWAFLHMILGAVIGVILGVLPKLYDTRDFLLIVVALCVAIFCAASALYSQHVSRAARTLLPKLDRITTELGRPAEFFPKDLHVDDGHYFREIVRYIRGTQPGDVIWIMTSHFAAKSAPRTQAVHDERQKYHDALEDRARHGVCVKRVFCFNQNVAADSLEARFFSRHTTDHCKRLMEIAEQNPDSVSLRMSRSFVGMDFLVIPRRVAAVTADCATLMAGYRTSSAGSSLALRTVPSSTRSRRGVKASTMKPNRFGSCLMVNRRRSGRRIETGHGCGTGFGRNTPASGGAPTPSRMRGA